MVACVDSTLSGMGKLCEHDSARAGCDSDSYRRTMTRPSDKTVRFQEYDDVCESESNRSTYNCEKLEIDMIRYQHGIYYRAAADYVLQYGPRKCKEVFKRNPVYRRALNFITGVAPGAFDLGSELLGIACDILPRTIIVDRERLAQNNYNPAVSYLLTVGGPFLRKEAFIADPLYRQAALLVLGGAAKKVPTIPVFDHEEEEEEVSGDDGCLFHNPFTYDPTTQTAIPPPPPPSESTSFLRKTRISEVSYTTQNHALRKSAFCSHIEFLSALKVPSPSSSTTSSSKKAATEVDNQGDSRPARSRKVTFNLGEVSEINHSTLVAAGPSSSDRKVEGTTSSSNSTSSGRIAGNTKQGDKKLVMGDIFLNTGVFNTKDHDFMRRWEEERSNNSMNEDADLDDAEDGDLRRDVHVNNISELRDVRQENGFASALVVHSNPDELGFVTCHSPVTGVREGVRIDNNSSIGARGPYGTSITSFRRLTSCYEIV